eukprot:3311390-Amphidinium_carterae.1
MRRQTKDLRRVQGREGLSQCSQQCIKDRKALWQGGKIAGDNEVKSLSIWTYHLLIQLTNS